VLSAEKKLKLIEALKEKLQRVGGIVFAYVHGSFVERDSFRDLDVVLWVKSEEDAFYYAVDFSAKLESEMKVPVDVQVLNEAPLPFKHHVFTRGRLLFSNDESLRLRLVDEVTRQYADLKMVSSCAGMTSYPKGRKRCSER